MTYLFKQARQYNNRSDLSKCLSVKFPQQETKRHHFTIKHPESLILQRAFIKLLELEILSPADATVGVEELSPSFPPPQAADPGLTLKPLAGVLMFTLSRVAPSMFVL